MRKKNSTNNNTSNNDYYYFEKATVLLLWQIEAVISILLLPIFHNQGQAAWRDKDKKKEGIVVYGEKEAINQWSPQTRRAVGQPEPAGRAPASLSRLTTTTPAEMTPCPAQGRVLSSPPAEICRKDRIAQDEQH